MKKENKKRLFSALCGERRAWARRFGNNVVYPVPVLGRVIETIARRTGEDFGQMMSLAKEWNRNDALDRASCDC